MLRAGSGAGQRRAGRPLPLDRRQAPSDRRLRPFMQPHETPGGPSRLL